MTERFNLVNIPAPVAQVQVSAPRHLARTRLIPGLTLFSFNKETSEVKPVEYKEAEYSVSGSFKRKVAHQPNLVYVQALNQRNAERKFNKLLN